MVPKIITLLPTRGFVLTEVESALDKELAANKQSPVVLRTWDMALPLSRNFLVETALKEDYWTHALLIDDDVIIPKGGLANLLKLDADVAVIDYPMQVKRDGEFVGTVVTNKDKSVVWAGLGCALVKRHVFEKIPQPWFTLTNFRVGRSQDGEVGFFQSPKQGYSLLSGGEDTFFFLQVRKAGFTIKKSKLIAQHCRIDQMITTMHNNKYERQHTITKLDKIERESL